MTETKADLENQIEYLSSKVKKAEDKEKAYQKKFDHLDKENYEFKQKISELKTENEVLEKKALESEELFKGLNGSHDKVMRELREARELVDLSIEEIESLAVSEKAWKLASEAMAVETKRLRDRVCYLDHSITGRDSEIQELKEYAKRKESIIAKQNIDLSRLNTLRKENKELNESLSRERRISDSLEKSLFRNKGIIAALEKRCKKYKYAVVPLIGLLTGALLFIIQLLIIR